MAEMIEFDPAQHYIFFDVVRHDPMAAFVIAQSRVEAVALAPEAEHKELGQVQELIKDGFDFLLEHGGKPQQIPGKINGKYVDGFLRVSGGAMRYQTSAGSGTMWLEGTYRVHPRISPQPVASFEDIDARYSTLSLIASLGRAYSSKPNRTAALFNLHPEEGMTDRAGSRCNAKDIIYCREIVDKIKGRYIGVNSPETIEQS